MADEFDCSICLEEDGECVVAVQLPCSHVFCEACMHKWRKHSNTCPLCRKPCAREESVVLVDMLQRRRKIVEPQEASAVQATKVTKVTKATEVIDLTDS